MKTSLTLLLLGLLQAATAFHVPTASRTYQLDQTKNRIQKLGPLRMSDDVSYHSAPSYFFGI